MSSEKTKRTSRASGDKKRSRSTTSATKGGGARGPRSGAGAAAGAKKRKATPAADRSGGGKTKQHKSGGDKAKVRARTKPSTDGVAKAPRKPKAAAAAPADGAAGDATTEGKKAKVSARNITVNWKPRVEYGVRTQPYRRLLNFYAHQKLPEMRMASGVAKALQSSVEEEVVEILRRASVCAVHAKRNTVNAQDIELQAKLLTSKSGDSEDLMAWAQKKLSKRAGKPKSRKPAKAKPADGGDASAPGANADSKTNAAASATKKPKAPKAPKAKKAKDATAPTANVDATAQPSDMAVMPAMVAPVGA
jgi:histone H3/H4